MWKVWIRARTRPGRSHRATRASRVSGSSQWNAVAQTTEGESGVQAVPAFDVGGNDLGVRVPCQVGAYDLGQAGSKLDGQDLVAAGRWPGRCPGRSPARVLRGRVGPSLGQGLTDGVEHDVGVAGRAWS